MKVTFRLSALGFGGTERVFISVADYLAQTHAWSIDFVVDQIAGHETEQIVVRKGFRLIGLTAPRTWKSILPFHKYLRAEKPDVVISAYTETNAAALFSNALNQFKTTMIITEHASLDEHWARKPRLRRLMLEGIVRYVYRLADRVTCVSHGMARQLGRRLKKPSVGCIHNPVRFAQRTRSVALARAALGIDTATPMVLAVGRISVQKNYLMLLQAVKHLDPANPVNLYIVGGVFEHEEKRALDQFIAAQGLADQVHFVDFTHEVHAYYEAADMLVLSSAWEGFGNVLVEALAFGLPIVSTNCNFGPAEILADGEYGTLVAVNDAAAMGQAIQRVLNNNPFVASRQIERALLFSEQTIGSAYHRMIVEAVGGKP